MKPHTDWNLDDENEVAEFIAESDGMDSTRLAEALGCSTGVAGALSEYAAAKHAAITRRMSGRIEIALRYEALCELLYSDLPRAVKW